MIFQIDSPFVKEVYANIPNYKVEYDETVSSKNTCAVYFSSNDIYYPNTENVFRKRIMQKDFFEWYNTRVKVYKHIFIRDIFKQWYLEGINEDLDNPYKLTEWLHKETNGYDVVNVSSMNYNCL